MLEKNAIWIAHKAQQLQVKILYELKYASEPEDENERLFKIQYSGDKIAYVYKWELKFI